MARTADPQDIPRRLIQAGHALFTHDGYHATGVAQIAHAAGVPKGSFYNHFDSKEAFAARIIAHYAEGVTEAWERCAAQAPQDDALATVRSIFETFIAHHARTECQGCLVGNFAAEMAASSPLCREVLQSAMADWRQRLADLLSQAQAQGRVRADLPAMDLATLFWDAWEGALLRTKIARSTLALHQITALLMEQMFRPAAAG